MEGQNSRFTHRRGTRFIQLGVGLLLALGLLWNPKTASVQSSPQPQVTLNVPAEVLIGEDFTFRVKFKNAGSPGDIGYGPFIDLVLDAGGANINKNNPACPCDGITFVKAEMVGVVGGPVPLNSFPVSAPCNPMPPAVSLAHPFALSGIGPVTVPAGAQLITLELPFGSFDPTQPEIEVEVTAHVSNLADAGTPLKIFARGGFRYGADPLDNPSQDPPILSDTTPATQWTAQAQTTPTVLTIKKEYLGPEDETATGPNFISYYPLRYRITVDIANGQTVSNVTVTDCFPNNLAFHSVVSVSPMPPMMTSPPVDVPSNPPNNCLTVTWSSLTGASGPDATVVVEFFIPEKDANGNPVLPPNCQPVQSVNDVKAEGDWTPIDQCDTSLAHVVSDITSSDHILNDKCIAIQKEVAVFQDTGAPGPTPGDVLQYTLKFQVSDFKTFGKLEVRDWLADGQQFLPAPAPTLTVTDQFGTVTGPFTPSDLSVTLDPHSTCQGIKGTTNLVFHVSQKMTNLNPPNPRHQAGILTGGWATMPTSPVPATGQIVFYARIQDQFSFPQNHPGDKFVDKDDPLANCVEIRGEVFTNVNPPQLPTPTGVMARDDSKSLTAIVTDFIKKTVYAVKRGNNFICGPSSLPGNPPPCPAKPQVTAGDEVTFRIEKVIPSSDAENLTIQDWLPLPIFDVADPDADSINGPPWNFTSTACGILTPGQACLGPSDTLHTLPVSPTFTFDATTNSLKFDYGTFNDPTNTPRKIDLLFTVTATNDPFADGLFLTNQAQECEKNTFNMTFCQTAIAQVQMAEPKLRIIKGVVASDNPNAIFSPAAPPSGTFTPPGGSCPRFNGTINSSNIGSLNLNSNISNVDAHDKITFAIVVENQGSSPNGVFDVKIRDIFPLDPTDRPSCFVPDFNTLCVTDGAGIPIPFTVSPSGFGSVIIELTDSGPTGALGPFHPTNGKNIVVITFDAQLLGDIKSGCCDNRARLENYSNTEGGPNFVAAGLGGPFEDTAQACVGPRPFAKCIQTTSEVHTTAQSASQGGTVDAAIGEIVRYRLITVIPEGTTLGFQIQDFLPPGLTYLPGTARVVFVADSSVTSGNAFWPTVPGPNPPQCPGPPTPTGNLLEGGGPFTPGAGVDPIFFVGVQSLPITNNDNDPDLEFAIIEFNALVDNIASNQSSTTLPNQFQVRFTNEAGTQFALNSGTVNVHVVEPQLILTKSVSPAAVVPGGGPVTYTVTIANTGTADAFDIVFTDTLPADLSLVPASLTFPAGCAGGAVGQNVSVTCPQLDDGTTIQITYQATVSATALCPCLITNHVTVTWTSLPGPKGTCPNPTGSCTPGNSGAIDGERNGSSVFPPNPPNSPDPPNKYHATASAALTVNCPPCVDPASFPSMVAWWPLDELNGSAVVNDLAGVNNQGTPTPGSLLGAQNAPNAVAGQVGGAIQFNSNLQPNGPHLTVPDHAELNFGTGGFSIDAWVYAPPSPPTALFLYPIVDKLIVVQPTPNVGAPVKGYAFYLDNGGTPAGARLRLTLADGSAAANYTGPSIPFNTWTHVAVTVDRMSGTVTFYVNGTPTVVAAPPMPTGSIDTPGIALLIGESRLLGPQAEIIIDELEMFKSVLTQADIQNIKTSGKCKCAGVSNEQVSCKPDGTFSYTATLTNLSGVVATGINIVPPSGVTITPSSITTPLSPGQSITGTVTISGPNAQPGATICFDVALTGQGVVICQTKHCITLPTCPGPGPCVQAPSGMVGWWPLNDAVGQSTVQDLAGGNNGTTKDVNGNPLNITLGAGPQVVSQLPASNILNGQLNPVVVDPNTSLGALFFNRSFVEVPHNPNLNIGPNGFTLTLWVFTAGGVEPIQPLVEKLGLNDGYSLYLDSWDSTANTYTLKFWLNGNFITGPKLQLSSPLSPSDWHFIVVRVSPPGSVTLTVCDLTGSCTTSPPTTVANFTTSNTAPLRFGLELGLFPALFIAKELALDEVEIFNRALTSAELQAIYDAERQGRRKCPCVPPPSDMVAWYPLDEQAGATTVSDIAPPPGSTVSDTGTPKPGPVSPVPSGGGPAPVAGKVGAGALYFYGDVFVEVPHSTDLTFTGDFSIDAWIRVVCGPVGIVDKWDPNTQTGFSLFVNETVPGTGTLNLQINNTLFTSTAPVPLGANPLGNTGPWVHVAVTVNRTSGVGTFYIDGAPAGTFTVPGGSITNTLPMLIGKTRVQPTTCEFAIDELELFNRALTQQEIQNIFNAGSAGKCQPQLGQICVVKFEDLDGDGVQDSGEPLLAGWQFTVTDANNNPVGTITTSPPGTPSACLTVAAPGTYTVTEQVQSGWTPTTPNPQTVTVQPGQTANLIFGNQGKGEICIFKFHDLDGDSVQDPNEPPLPGWQFTVSPAPLPPTTSPVTTGPDGRICFGVVAPGTYTITEQVQPSWTPTTPTTQTVTVQPGQTVNVAFGNKKQPGQICVVKFEDLDGDGVQDPGEPLLAGWQFTVTDASGAMVGTITTSQPGTPPACLTVPAPGTYTVTETVQPGWTPTAPPSGSQTVTVQPGQTVNLTFGNGRCITAPSGMVAWWWLDDPQGSTVVKDSIGPYNASPKPGPVGPPTFPASTPGKVASALLFTEQAYAEVPGPASGLNPGAGEFTVDAWVYFAGADETATVIRKMQGGGGTPSPALGIGVNTPAWTPGYIWRIQKVPFGTGWALFFAVKDAAGQFRSNFATIPVNQWVHLAMVLRRTPLALELYINGSLAQTGAGSFTLGAISNDYPFLIGGDGVEKAELKVDELEFFNRALTQQEIQSIYNAGSAGKCKTTADLGDAPDSSNHANQPMTAYTGVTAKFPTVFDPATGLPQGPKHLQPKKLAWLGDAVSLENEADMPPDADGVTNIDPSTNAADRDKFDDGVALPIAIPMFCGQTQFQYTVTSTAAAKLYVNVWFDFNRDGDWDDPTQACPLGPNITGSFTEWAVQNQPIVVVPGLNTFTTPVFGAANPTKGKDMWMRITLTDQPIAPANGKDGSGPAGGYEYGETEDYLLRLEYAELCGVKFEDKNGNGKQDSGEPGLAQWVIEVKDANGNIIGYAVTDANGRYCIVVPSPGTYIVSEQQQASWVQTAPPTPGTYTVTVPPAHTDLNFGNKKKEEEAKCDLKIEKKVEPSPLVSGQQATVSITVTNVGNGPCQGVTTMTDGPLPWLQVTSVAQGGSLWNCSVAPPNPGATVSCTWNAPVPPGPLPTITITGTVVASAGSQIENCATVSNQNDINPQNNQSCVTLQVTGCVTPPANMTAWWPLDETSGTTANDLAGVPNNGTHVNGPTPTPGMVAGALRFDGVDDHVRVPNHAELNVGTGNFTLDAWVRTTASEGMVVLVDKRSAFGPAPSINIPLGYSLFLVNGRLGFQMANGVGSSTCAPTPTPGVACVNYVAAAPNVADGQWHHVAAVVDRADMTSGVRLYVDGVQVFTGAPLGAPPSGSPSTPANLDNTSDLYMGMRTPGMGGGGFLRGDLDEVELIKRALSQQEIQTLFQAGSAGKCKLKLPDLIVTNLRVLPSTIPRGGSAVVSFDIKNQGEGEAGPATHEVRLIIRRAGSDMDLLLGRVTTGRLAPGASQSFAVPIRLPQDVPTGTALIRVRADSGDTLNESNEENNTAEVQITIAGEL